MLETVAVSSQPLSLSDIAAALALDKSTAYRMLNTLVDAGFVLRDEISKRYSLSYKVALSRNLLAENETSRVSRQILEGLTAVTGETVHLSVLDGHQTVLIQKVKGTQLVAVDFEIGDRSLLHCTSIGKVLLAFQDVRVIEEVIAAGCGAGEQHDHRPGCLSPELHRIRSQGYALDDHELSDNMRCIAAPIFEQGGRVRMGISISGPDTRFTFDKLDELRGPLLQAAWTLSERLGAHPG